MSDSDLENDFLTAAGNGHLEKLRECIENGVNVNCVGDRNKKYTALHKACSKNNLDCVKYLIEHGADVDAEAESNITPLHVAAEGAHVDVIRELITKVSDVNKCTSAKSGGDTALHWLLKNPPTGGRYMQDIKQIVNILHKYGANLNATNADENSTALHLCVKNKCPEIIKELLRLKADPNIEDKDFTSPRQLAIFQGAEEETAKAFEDPSVLQNVAQTIEADGCPGDGSRVIGGAGPPPGVNPGPTPVQAHIQSPTQNITVVNEFHFNKRVNAVVMGDGTTVNTVTDELATDEPS